jgi:alpha-L-rhamnosidase
MAFDNCRGVMGSSVRFLLMSIAIGSCALRVAAATGDVKAKGLRCEYRVNPLGIDIVQPRLSWILKSAHPGERGLGQSAYRVLVATSAERLDAETGDLWDSGKVDSQQSIQIKYDGKQLNSQQSVWWKVKVWDQDGRPSPWSSLAQWSMGLLGPADWTGKWIGVTGGDGASEELTGAHWISDASAGQHSLWFRHTFEISEKNLPSYGLLVVAGSSEVTAFVNGTKVVSGFGKFPHGNVTQSISEMLHPGKNVLAVALDSDGPVPPGGAGIIAGITLDLANGGIQHIQTDQHWKVSDTAAPNWEKPEFDSSQWSNASIVHGEAPVTQPAERTRLAARMLRKQFQLDSAPRKAMLYVSGLGYSEIYVNGHKISKDVLAPALTDYDKRVFYVTYDVTSFLHDGDNAVGILLGNGRFFAPRRYIPVFTRTFGRPEARLQIDIEDGKGKHLTLASDESWKATTEGPIRANNEYDGEEYDARMEQNGWTLAGFDDRKWNAAQLVDPPGGAVRAQMSAPIRIMRELRPVKITEPEPGVYVFDMGQNMVGWCRVHVSGPSGTRITLRHAETLRSNGMLYTDNLRSARQTDVYILKGEGAEVYEPRFVSHGFRYVEVRGLRSRPSSAMLTGRVLYDALPENADLVTSNQVINHIYRNMLWGDRGNYHSVPTDCPQRDERQGWLGDRSAESKGESFIFDVSQFYSQWLQDIEDSMDSQGRINDVAPAYWPFYKENVVWPASFFIVAEMLHQQYGDDAIIQEHYPAMKRWVDHMRTLVKSDLMPLDVYGDWCVPPKSLHEIFSKDPASKTSPEILGTTYFYHILRLMSQFAVISGHSEDQEEFDELASRMKAAFNDACFKASSSQYSNGTQTSSILPLALGLAPEDSRQVIADTLATKIEVDSHGFVGTGLDGTQWLMQTLTNNGHIEVAYQIATQTKYPSWGYMLDRGATTMWELWNGDTANPAMNSRNHLMLLGDFATWLYEDLAGIESDPNHPGFKHILIHPHIVGDLTFVRASHVSPYGRIATDWRLERSAFTLRISIPPNTTATVYIPTSDSAGVTESGKPAKVARGVRLLSNEDGVAVYAVGSGDYVFASRFGAAKKSGFNRATVDGR